MTTDMPFDSAPVQPILRENNRSRAAFEDYYALGPGRSLAALLSLYRARIESIAANETIPADQAPPTLPPARRLATLKAWSAAFGWQARVAARDQAAAEAADRAFEAERTKALQSGFALLHKRVAQLDALAGKLLAEIERPAGGGEGQALGELGGLWLRDVKAIGAGEHAREVEIFRFNAPLVEQFRGALGDIAAELGARVKGVEVVGKGGGPVQVSVIEVIAPGLEGSSAAAAAGAAAAAAGAAGVDDA